MNEKSLFCLAEGCSGSVRTIGVEGPLRARLMDLGFSPGAEVTCLFSAPSGDPRAYMIKNSVIALRSSDADKIYLEEV